jgi:hypothetical protein
MQKFCISYQEAFTVKTLRQICAATILSLTFAVSIFAGQIDCPGVVEPPPPTSEASTLTEITSSLIMAVISVIPIS